MEKIVKTKIWSVDKHVNNLLSSDAIQEAARLLQENEVVAFPTETVYGLGGNAYSDEAIEKIFHAKGRPSDNPLIVHIYSKKQLLDIAQHVPKIAEPLIDSFWPGPLTIIFPKTEAVSEKATAGLSTVAVRMPDHPVALALLEKADIPIAAPSANRSGKPSPTTAQHVLEDLRDKIAGVVDGGKTDVGVESTVIDVTGPQIEILRPGGITREQIEAVAGKENVRQPSSFTGAVKSPGMKYTHYSPNAPLYLVLSKERIHDLIAEKKAKGKRVGVLTTVENAENYDADYVHACGERADLATVASQLYESLRQFDVENMDVIISEAFPKEGIGAAIMNRLEKAAVKIIQ